MNDYWVYNADEQELDATCVPCGFNSRRRGRVRRPRPHPRVPHRRPLDWSSSAAAGIRDLDLNSARSEVAREVVCHLAMQLGQADQPLVACLCCLDEQIEDRDLPARRSTARRAALLARRNADVADDELRAAVAQLGAVDPVALLGTTERREAVRRRLARLGRLGSSSMPALAAELTRIGAEPLPAAEDDDVWHELCTWMLAGAVAPEQN